MIPYSEKNKLVKEGAEIILFKLGNLKKNEKLCIIVDNDTVNLGTIFKKIADNNSIENSIINIPKTAIHGTEPPKNILNQMYNFHLILGLTKESIAHTNARYNASKKGIRFLSLADYSLEVLAHPSIRADFQKLSKHVEKLSKRFSSGEKIVIKTEKGTDLLLDITNRRGNYAPGFVNDKILLGSPPDIEANVPPIENKSKGVIVIDGSIPNPKLGKLKKPIKLEIKNGKIESIEGNSKQKKYLMSLFEKYGNKSKILAELGVGFNNLGQICGNMLIDEGTLGTVHCGFGSNSTIGGANKINFHLDFVFYCDKIMINNKTINFNSFTK